MKSQSKQSVTIEYRWGVVAANEPVGIRTIKGYVTILERQISSGAPESYHILFFDINGLPIQSFLGEDFPLFADAAYMAWKELGLPDIGGSPGESLAALVPLAGGEG